MTGFTTGLSWADGGKKIILFLSGWIHAMGSVSTQKMFPGETLTQHRHHVIWVFTANAAGD